MCGISGIINPMQGEHNMNRKLWFSIITQHSVCINNVRFVVLPWQGVQISYNHFLRLPAKYKYLASALYCILPAALGNVLKLLLLITKMHAILYASMSCKRLTHLDHISEETMATMNAMVINRTATTVTATGTTTLLTYAPWSRLLILESVYVWLVSVARKPRIKQKLGVTCLATSGFACHTV